MRMLYILISMVIVVSFTSPRQSRAAEPASEEAVEKFLELQVEFRVRQELFWELAKHATDEQLEKMFEAMYPKQTMVLQFLLLEEQNRGNQVGASCLHHLVTSSDGIGLSTSAAARGKQIALNRLVEHYADDPILDVILQWTDDASELNKETERLLQIAAQSPHRHVQAAALYTSAKHLKERGVDPEMIRGIMALLAEAGNERTALQSDYYQLLRETYDSLYHGHDAETARKEALQILNEISLDYAGISSIPRGGTGPVLIEHERTFDSEKQPTYGELAERLRFELNHLAIGQTAPDINQLDAFGKPLRLYDHRGKVTVLFFSFKGCGPCEVMYPENRRLIEDMKDRPFAFLGVMGDETIDTVHEAVKSGKITWPVWWGGPDRELSDKWNVRGWPMIYVIDHTGIIRYKDLRFGLLTRAVNKLVTDAEATK